MHYRFLAYLFAKLEFYYLKRATVAIDKGQLAKSTIYLDKSSKAMMRSLRYG